jgi:hypothetical protein
VRTIPARVREFTGRDALLEDRGAASDTRLGEQPMTRGA